MGAAGIHLGVSEREAGLLRQLVGSGLFGDTIEDVLRYAMLGLLQGAARDGFLKPLVDSATAKPAESHGPEPLLSAATFLAEIDAFLERTGMSPTALGRKAVNRPSLVKRLRAGAELRTRTIDSLRAFMAEHPEGIARKDRRSNGWSADEIAFVAENYAELGAKSCAEHLGRSLGSVYQIASANGISRFKAKPPVDLKVNERRVPLGDRRFRENQPPKPAAHANPAPKPPLSFDEQMEKVANGAKIIECGPIKAPPPDHTLGGVVGPIT